MDEVVSGAGAPPEPEGAGWQRRRDPFYHMLLASSHPTIASPASRSPKGPPCFCSCQEPLSHNLP